MANFAVVYDACLFYLKDFPQRTLDGFEIAARHPDDFVLDLADLEPGLVIAVAKQQRAALQHPPLAPEAFVDCLRRQVATASSYRCRLM